MTARAPADAPHSTGLSRRFKVARDRAGITQRKLALKAGCPLSTITGIEAGGRMPQIDTIEVLARALGVSSGWLAYGDDVPPPDWLDGDEARKS